MRRALLCLALCAPATAFAACPGEVLLSCPIGKKQLDLCLTSSAVTYSFGPRGAPELVLSSPLTEAAFQPWPGVGSAIWDAVSFTNKGTTYEVWTSLDRNTPNAVWEGGVNVLKGEALVAQLTCAPGTVQGELSAIFAAKEAAGLCWSHESFRWQTACP